MRNLLIYKLNQIDKNIELLRKIVIDMSDEELSGILYDLFYEFGVNIGNNLGFMKMILTKEDDDNSNNGKSIRKLRNDELVKYFKENKNLLTFPSQII